MVNRHRLQMLTSAKQVLSAGSNMHLLREEALDRTCGSAHVSSNSLCLSSTQATGKKPKPKTKIISSLYKENPTLAILFIFCV